MEFAFSVREAHLKSGTMFVIAKTPDFSLPFGDSEFATVSVLVLTWLAASVVNACFLRLALAWYNRLVGGTYSEAAVATPSFVGAMGIAAVILLLSFGARFATRTVVGLTAVSMGATPLVGSLIATLVAVGLVYLIITGVLTSTLSTTFGRAALITLLYYTIILIIWLVAVVAPYCVATLIEMWNEAARDT